MSSTDVLIVGAGLAGARCAEALRARGFAGRIVVAGEEEFPPYERPALSKQVITDGRDLDEIALRSRATWDERGIELRLGAPVSALDIDGRRALVGGRPMAWRTLVVATGARARRIPGLPDVAGVHHLRGLADARALRADLRPGSRMAVIGAGFVGAELASSARDLDVQVDVIELEELPFGRLFGAEVGSRLADRMRAAGVRLHLGARVEGLACAEDRVAGVRLAGGAIVPCDLVVVGVGARPNTEIVAGQIELSRDCGIRTDAAGRTEHPHVFACGDVASPWHPELGRHARLEHWSSAAAGARAVAAAIMAEEVPEPGVPYVWSDQFGWCLQLVGHPLGSPRIVDDAGDDGFVVRFEGAGGTLRGGMAVERPDAIPSLRAEVAASATVLEGILSGVE